MEYFVVLTRLVQMIAVISTQKARKVFGHTMLSNCLHHIRHLRLVNCSESLWHNKLESKIMEHYRSWRT